MDHDLGFIHKYIPPANSGAADTLVLFHGTGGDEDSMIQIGMTVSREAGLLSPRGKVLENGLPRFFRRLSEGVFDHEDMKVRTLELVGFINGAANVYGYDLSKLSALGYSNGANIAASLMLTYPGVFKNAALFHPMIPFMPESLPDLSGTRILITAGTNDPIVKTEETEGLTKLFLDSGALAEIFWHNNGHNLTREEIDRAKVFLLES